MPGLSTRAEEIPITGFTDDISKSYLQNFLKKEEYKEYLLHHMLQTIITATKGDPGYLDKVVKRINSANSLTDVAEICQDL